MKEKKIQVGEYTVVQTYNCHIHILKNGKWWGHVTCTKELTEEQLKEQLQFMIKLAKGDYSKCDK